MPKKTYKASKQRFQLYRRYLKRLMDCILSFCALIVLAPLLLGIAFLIKFKLGSPVLFKQPRPGLNEKVFMIYKFRTMMDQYDGEGKLLPDEKRLTKFGSLLRSTSLDELPELLNILKGDMSLVGPRPLLVQYLPLYNEHQRLRHSVRPGLTGYAQVNGRNAISWEEKFDLDVGYVNNINFIDDLKIIFRTFVKVYKREDVNASVSLTMEAFTGNKAIKSRIL